MQNQREVYARSGFKVLGIVGSSSSSEKAKKVSKTNISSTVKHYSMPPRTYRDVFDLSVVKNEQNHSYFETLLKENGDKLGYLGLKKLVQRIIRLRKNILSI